MPFLFCAALLCDSSVNAQRASCRVPLTRLPGQPRVRACGDSVHRSSEGLEGERCWLSAPLIRCVSLFDSYFQSRVCCGRFWSGRVCSQHRDGGGAAAICARPPRQLQAEPEHAQTRQGHVPASGSNTDARGPHTRVVWTRTSWWEYTVPARKLISVALHCCTSLSLCCCCSCCS